MNSLIVSVKLNHPDAKMPTYSRAEDGALDLTAATVTYDTNEKLYVYNTGINVVVPSGYVGLIYPRSSISKTGLQLCNSVGVLDSGYVGDILLKFRVVPGMEYSDIYKPGDRIGQLMIVPRPKIVLQTIKELPQTERGNKGFGSSGA